MSYFAVVRCPKCGKTKTLMLGGYGFGTYSMGGNHKEKCSYCGCEFNPQECCESMEHAD